MRIMLILMRVPASAWPSLIRIRVLSKSDSFLISLLIKMKEDDQDVKFKTKSENVKEGFYPFAVTAVKT